MMIGDGSNRKPGVSAGVTRLGAVVMVTGLVCAACQSGTGSTTDEAKTPAPSMQASAPQSFVERGRYLTNFGGCNDCHTPLKMGSNGPEPDMTLEWSGHPEALKMPPPPKLPAGPWNWIGAGTNTAFAGPWGVSFSANLTPDSDTGLGIWTDDLFLKAIRSGKHFGTSRPIMPPMPWVFYAQMSDEDLKAIFAYLRTVKPVKNHVPDYIPPTESH